MLSNETTILLILTETLNSLNRQSSTRVTILVSWHATSLATSLLVTVNYRRFCTLRINLDAIDVACGLMPFSTGKLVLAETADEKAVIPEP